MFWNQITPRITARLQRAVDDAYRVFAPYRRTGTIIHCDCSVCMTPEVAAQLSTLPLRAISAALLAEYTNSAHGYDTGAIEREFMCLLPRYLDLIAHCEPPHYDALDVCLQRLRLADYRKRWSAPEREAVDGFFDAFLAASLEQLGLAKWPVGLRLEFDMGEVLNMTVTAGGDLQRVLAEFDRGPDPQAAVHMAHLRGDVHLTAGGPYWHSAFLEGELDANARVIGVWLMRERVTERILNAADLLNDSDYDDTLAAGLEVVMR